MCLYTCVHVCTCHPVCLLVWEVVRELDVGVAKYVPGVNEGRQQCSFKSFWGSEQMSSEQKLERCENFVHLPPRIYSEH